jgi:FdhD protein
METTRPGRSVEVETIALDGKEQTRKYDRVVTEEPLELRLLAGGTQRTLAITMRTPGNDFELAAGFAFGEGVVARQDEIAELTYCVDPSIDPEQRYNIVTIELRAGRAAPDFSRFERHFAINSACGVCGRAQLESLRELGAAPIDDDVRVAARQLYRLPELMRQEQRTFATTGGLHAAALFDERGNLVALREDVGRHNALDKLVGWAPQRSATVAAPRRDGKRSRKLRDSAEVGHGRRSDRRLGLGAEQPRGRAGARVQRNARRIRARRTSQPLRRVRPNHRIKNSLKSRLKTAGLSALATWPAPGIISSCAPWMLDAISFESEPGAIASCSP